MKRMVATGLAVVFVGVLAARSEAGGCCAPPPCCEMQVTYVDKVVTCFKPVWKEKDVTCVVNKLIPHEEKYTVKCVVHVPDWKTETRKVIVCKLVPREVERTVCCVKMVPVTCTDPCTGCTYTCCKPETVTQKVRAIVCESVPEVREVTVKVCCFRAEERTVECRRIVCECKQETVTQRVKYCEMVPYEAKVKVAVCTPVCAAPCK